MNRLDELLNEYSLSHQNPRNIRIHIYCVPLIAFSILGILLSIPLKLFGLPFVYLPVLFVGIYYYHLSLKFFSICFALLLFMLFVNMVIAKTGYLLELSFFLFVLSWAFQFYGHKIEGQKPSFLEDLQFLLIGPIWVLKHVFKKL